MINLTWQFFSQTGNIEAYLLFKELEKQPEEHEPLQYDYNTSSIRN